jgi:hypothetical protein
MVDIEVRLPKKGLIKVLDEAYDAACDVDLDIGFLWTFEEGKLRIQDNFFMADLGDFGWISFDSKEFTVEMLEMILEENPKLATEGVFNALIAARAKNRESEE